jgi:uncharacterized phage-associated protein
MEVKMATFSVDLVADTLIHLARERNLSDLTNLKLQKLLYYAQAWNLAFSDECLFAEDIEAWVHGPVVPRVFRRFKALGWKTIDTKVNPLHGPYLASHLKLILTAYGSFSATQLERLTHSEDPWRIARNGIPSDVSSNAVISHKSMKMYYKALLSGRR